MRLIDADALIYELNNSHYPGAPYVDAGISIAIGKVCDAPTIELTANSDKYEYHYDHTDCIWYRPEARNRCPSTCAQYRDGWNDAMNYIFRDGKGYRPYRRDKQYEERKEGEADG